jgi:hypothetical protein
MKRTTSMNSLYRLIYCSRRIAEPDGNRVGVEEAILSVARSKNLAVGLTGALIATGCGFMQVLEGTRDAVERTFERIGADRRHCDVTVLTFTPAERRCFPHWTMAFSDRLPEEVADPVAGVLATERQRTITGHDMLRLMERIIYGQGPMIS